MKSLIYETTAESKENLLAWVMATANAGLSIIGDRVHQNIIHRYNISVDVDDHHIEPFL